MKAVSRREFLALGGAALVSGTLAGRALGESGEWFAGGSSLTVGMPTDVLLGQVFRFTKEQQMLWRTVFDYLIDRKLDGSYTPRLATSWEWNSSHSKLVLNLRPGVTYHNGRSFGPADVIATIEAALAPGSSANAATILKRVHRMKKTGAHQVTFTFSQPAGNFMDGFAMLPIVDHTAYSSYAAGQKVIGTGPFMWESYRPGDTIQLKRNPSYWKNGKPYLDAVTLKIITDSNALSAAMLSGEIDLANRMLARDAGRLRQNSGYHVGATVASEIYVGANVAAKPLDDLRVRQAIAWSLDRTRIADQVFPNFGFASALPWSTETPGMKKSYRTHYTYETAKAKAMIQAAGATGAKVAVTAFPGGPEFAATAAIVSYNLQQIGLSPTTVSYDSAGFSKALQSGSLPGLYVISNALAAWGPAAALAASFPLEPGKNSSNVTDAKYQALGERLLEARNASDIKSANAAVTEYLLQQAFHMPVVQTATPIVSTSKVTGVTSDIALALDLTSARKSG